MCSPDDVNTTASYRTAGAYDRGPGRLSLFGCSPKSSGLELLFLNLTARAGLLPQVLNRTPGIGLFRTEQAAALQTVAEAPVRLAQAQEPVPFRHSARSRPRT